MISCADGRTSRSKRRGRVIIAALTGLTAVLLYPVSALASSAAPAEPQATWSIERTPDPEVANGSLVSERLHRHRQPRPHLQLHGRHPNVDRWV